MKFQLHNDANSLVYVSVQFVSIAMRYRPLSLNHLRFAAACYNYLRNPLLAQQKLLTCMHSAVVPKKVEGCILFFRSNFDAGTSHFQAHFHVRVFSGWVQTHIFLLTGGLQSKWVSQAPRCGKAVHPLKILATKKSKAVFGCTLALALYIFKCIVLCACCQIGSKPKFPYWRAASTSKSVS